MKLKLRTGLTRFPIERGKILGSEIIDTRDISSRLFLTTILKLLEQGILEPVEEVEEVELEEAPIASSKTCRKTGKHKRTQIIGDKE